MKNLVLTGVVLSSMLGGAAMAADMPVKARPPVLAPAAYNWSGMYIGGFVGGAWSDNVTVTDLGNGIVPYNGLLNHTWGYKLKSSFLGGGTVGWNWQAPGSAFVLGIEGEIGSLRVRGSAADPVSPALDTVSTTKIGDWYGFIGGRAGFAWDRALIYAKGGAVFMDRRATVVDTCNVFPCGVGLVNARSGKNRDVSWGAGGGIEWAFNNNWSMKAEYLFLNVDDLLASGVTTPSGLTVRWNHSLDGVHTAKVGLNYRFNWAGPVSAAY
jgi:outer membrane immunogenic protein